MRGLRYEYLVCLAVSTFLSVDFDVRTSTPFRAMRICTLHSHSEKDIWNTRIEHPDTRCTAALDPEMK